MTKFTEDHQLILDRHIQLLKLSDHLVKSWFHTYNFLCLFPIVPTIWTFSTGKLIPKTIECGINKKYTYLW